MSRILHSAVVALIVATASACATTMSVGSHIRDGLDVAQYRTYDWGPADALPTGDPRLDENPYFQDYVQGAVGTQLAAKGIARSTSGTPDLLIHYHASVDKRIDVNRTEREYVHCRGADCQSWIIQYEAGTLVVDIIDTRTNLMIFRAWAQESLADILVEPNRMKAKIDEAVNRMLADFPRPK